MRSSLNPFDILEPNRPSVIAIGVFDGVHRGHQSILKKTVELAHEINAQSIVITFDPHPDSLIHPDTAPPLIQKVQERLCWIERTGIDSTWVIQFNTHIQQMSPYSFMAFLRNHLRHIRAVVVGERFLFGFRRSGTIKVLESIGNEMGFSVHNVPTVKIDNIAVSSSLIRQTIAQGNFALAETLLGHQYWFRSTVIKGNRLGSKLGFPTANLDTSGMLLPPPGVYAAVALVDSSPAGAILHNALPAVVNIGYRPTVHKEAHQIQVEVHIIDAKLGLYGRWLAVRFLQKIRDEITFSNLEALKQQISYDVKAATCIINSLAYSIPSHGENLTELG